MTQISKRLSVLGPDPDGDYEITIAPSSDLSDVSDFTFITRAEADALIDALSVRDDSGRIVALPQVELRTRPPGNWDSNFDARGGGNDTGE